MPQNRERIYIVAFRNDIDCSGFKFPEGTNSNACIKDIVEENPVSVKYYLSDVYLETLRQHKERHASKGNGFGYEIRGMNDKAGAIVCGGMGRERNLIIDPRLTDFTPVTHIKGEVNREGVRKLTPREWARLQGFPDSYKLTLADTHLYKQFGNSVTVNVIEAIANEIKKVLEKEEEKVIKGSKNKGDWSEFYVLLYLAGKRKLYTADENLKQIKSFCFPIQKIIREDSPQKLVEFIMVESEGVNVCLNNELYRKMTSKQYLEEAEALYQDILNGKGSFDVPHAEEFLNEIHLERIAAPSSDITDIKMELHDTHTGIDQTMGFSIKSYIGGAPTLLNASGATNFVYEVIGMDAGKMDEINSINTRTKIMDRIHAVETLGGSLEFRKTASSVFSENLMMIDSRMEELLAEVIRYSYESNETDCKKIIEHLEVVNPLNYPRKGMYEYKFKQFLCAKALGMEPGSSWSGEDEANGGYIVAKADGSVLAYHLYNRDKFKQYLYENTKLERGSTSKHGYASLYEEDGKMFINLNLQIRFK